MSQTKSKTTQTNSSGQSSKTSDISIEQLIETREGRRELAQSFAGFCLVYLSHYMGLEPADFHPEMLEEMEDDHNQFLAIAGFRGCAKSTFASLALALWLGLEKEFKFGLLVGDTSAQSKMNLHNVRYELEENKLLRMDYGELIEKSEGKKNTMNEETIVLSNGVRYMARSRGQKIRGLRHRQYRPDFVIIDDPEELDKVDKKEYRDKTERWLTGDIIPAVQEMRCKLVVIANMLHTDSLMARIKSGKIGGDLFKYLEYALIDKNGKVTWRGKYPNQESLDRQKKKVGHTAWMREYLLKVVPPEGVEVKEEWIQVYDKLPEVCMQAGVGVDLAISKKETADFTAMVSGVVGIDKEGRPRIHVLPRPINERLSSLETQNQMKSLMAILKIYTLPTFYIEEVAYQKAAIEMAQAALLPVVGVKPGGDKRARLRTIATLIQNGTVVFPRSGCEDLISQLVNFGIEQHDDLCDAFVYMVTGMSEQGLELPQVILL